VPITPFLDGHKFDPATTRAMSVAFDEVCRSLGLVDKTDQATGLVAGKIIELALRGETDAQRLTAAALRAFDPNGSGREIKT
jgi:hypothetical protein